ncbi:hypothetical protein [Pseudomonas sp. PDM31]|uniref:hypothetical protein n=1 Tax=Pseudomonas sp. PDM31 TaxID=2854778 RepID=UPI001C48B126|nr:hypothetical protein [Pseudomonas sp. PDM31]MBV7480346.1 hypothetical protein [Pseudomonas sp. PDM31]
MGIFRLLATCLALLPLLSFGDTSSVEAPADQVQFTTVIVKYVDIYREAPNELKKSTAARKRLDELGTIKADPRNLKGWIGYIKNLGTTSDGDAYLEIVGLIDSMTFGTWNNSFSDLQDKTLIKNGTPLYDALSEMQEGDVVKFSGSLLKPKNMTEEGKMTSPEFLFHFKTVEKLGSKLPKK